MKTIKERRTAVLQDTIEYYTQDPIGRRCKNSEECCYSPKTVDKEATSEGLTEFGEEYVQHIEKNYCI